MKAQEERTDFHEKTDKFDLAVTLHADKITITLKDFIDWAIYQKEYTENSIGHEISHKMDLFDIYTAFSQTQQAQPQSETECMRKQQSQFTKLKQYEFGSVIQKNNRPCYKIEREGKISTYLTIIDIRINKQVTYESKLKLNKLRSMTENQISIERSIRQKDTTFYELIKQIEKQGKDKEVLVKRIIYLEEQNLKLKEALTLTKQQLVDRIEQLEYKINQKLYIQAEDIQLTKKIFNEELKTQLAEFKDEIQEKFAKISEKQQNQRLQRLQQKFSQLMQQFELQNQRNLDKLTKMELLNKPILYVQNLHSLEQSNSVHFRVNGLKVELSSPDFRTQYIFKMPIRHNQSATFRLKSILQQKSSWGIIIGIVDYAKQKNERSSYKSGNAMCYWSDGQKYPEKVKEQDGFEQGDVVEVEVNRLARTVKYIVNGIHKATHGNQMLADSSRVFMPYVELYKMNDSVEWMQ